MSGAVTVIDYGTQPDGEREFRVTHIDPSGCEMMKIVTVSGDPRDAIQRAGTELLAEARAREVNGGLVRVELPVWAADEHSEVDAVAPNGLADILDLPGREAPRVNAEVGR